MTTTPHRPDTEPADVHDMVVVHRVFRRELRLIPPLVRAVAPGDVSRAAVLARHVRIVLDGLHLHHTGEDELLWPLLAERAAPSAELVARMQAQHGRVEALLERLGPVLERWTAEARPAVGEELASTVDGLRVALVEHLDDEEAHILPLAARHVSQQEWDRLGEHGLAAMGRSEILVMCGMILEDATPEERTAMLANVPAPVRLLVRTLGAWLYRRHVSVTRTVPGPG